MFLPNFRPKLTSILKLRSSTMTMRRNRKSSFRQFCDQFTELQHESKQCRFNVPEFRSTYATQCTLLQQFLCCVSAACLALPTDTTMDRFDKPQLNAQFFQGILRKHERSAALIICDVRIESGTSRGDNYMSEVLRVYASGYQSNKCNENMLEGRYDYKKRIIVKETLASEQDLHKNEVYGYEHVLPLLQKCLPPNIKFEIPSAIYTSNDMIIMEDLGQFGYEKLDRSKSLPKPTMESVFKEIAKLHAASIILKHKHKNDFIEIENYLADQLMSESKKLKSKEYFKGSLEMAQYRVNTYDLMVGVENDPQSRLALEGFFRMGADEMFESAYQAINSVPEEMEVFIHGDFWQNNILFKNKNPGDIKVVDMATLCKSNLVRDLIYIFATSPMSTRNRIPYLEIYINTLRFYLVQQVDDRVIEKYTLNRLLEEMERLRYFELFISMLLAIPTQFTTVPDMQQLADCNNNKQQVRELLSKHLGIAYDNRIRYIIWKFYDIDYQTETPTIPTTMKYQ